MQLVWSSTVLIIQGIPTSSEVYHAKPVPHARCALAEMHLTASGCHQRQTDREEQTFSASNQCLEMQTPMHACISYHAVPYLHLSGDEVPKPAQINPKGRGRVGQCHARHRGIVDFVQSRSCRHYVLANAITVHQER